MWLKNVKEADIEFPIATDEWVILNVQETGMTAIVFSCTALQLHLNFIKVEVNTKMIDATASTFSFPHEHQYKYAPHLYFIGVTKLKTISEGS